MSVNIIPIATIPLEKGFDLSIPFRVKASADGSRLAVLNTFGLPYAQQLLVIDTATHKVVRRHRFAAEGTHLFNLDIAISGDGSTVVLVGGVLKDAAGQEFEPDCTLTKLDVESGKTQSLPVGPVGYNFVSVTPDGATAHVVYNGSNDTAPQHYDLRVIDLAAMAEKAVLDLPAPINNMLYRQKENRAVLSLGRDVVSFDLQENKVGDKLAPRFNQPYVLAAFAEEEDLVYASFVASETVIKTLDIKKRSVVGQHSFAWGWTASTNIEPFGADHLVIPPGSSAGAICLWNRHSGELDGQVGLPQHLILSAPHPDGRHLYLYDYTDQGLKVVEAEPLFRSAKKEKA